MELQSNPTSLDRSALAAEYLLDGNADDTSGNGNDGTATNVTGVGSERGYTSEVGSFNGSTSYVSITDFNYNMTTSFTYQAWIKVNNYTDWNGIIEQDSTTNRGVLFRTNQTTGTVNFIRLDSGGSVVTNITTTSAIGTGVWKMVTATFDNTVGSKIYIDGVLSASDTVLTNTNDATTPINIGARETGLNNYMDGDIGLARIYNKALSETEIDNLYQEGLRVFGPTNIPKYAETGIIENISYTTGYNVATQEANPQGVEFNSDGTKMYVTGYSGDDVNEYTLSVGYDLSSTVTYITNFSVSGQTSLPSSIKFKPDGTKFYVCGRSPDAVFQYSCSTAFDISTASYDSVSFSVAAQDGNPYEIVFNGDGTIMMMIGLSTAKVYQYSLSTGWDLSTASYSGNSLSVTGDRGLEFNEDGTKMLTLYNTDDKLYQYSLSTGWDITTATSDGVTFSVSSQDITPSGIRWGDNYSKIFVVGDGNNSVFEYNSPGKELFKKYSLSNLEDSKIVEISKAQYTTNTYADQSGNGNTGTAANVTDSSLGQNNVMSFNGSSSEIDFSSSIIPQGAKSISLWIKSSDTTNTQYYIGNIRVTTLDQGTVIVYDSTNGPRLLLIYGGSVFLNINPVLPSIHDGTWHHLVYTWDGTTGLNGGKFYLDGTLHTQTTATSITEGTPSYNMSIGREPDTTPPDSWYNGNIAQPQIWNRALSADEIQQLYYSNFISN